MLSKFLAYGSNVVNAKLTDMATVACAFANPNTLANGHKLRNYISLIYIYMLIFCGFKLVITYL